MPSEFFSSRVSNSLPYTSPRRSPRYHAYYAGAAVTHQAVDSFTDFIDEAFQHSFELEPLESSTTTNDGEISLPSPFPRPQSINDFLHNSVAADPASRAKTPANVNKPLPANPAPGPAYNAYASGLSGTGGSTPAYTSYTSGFPGFRRLIPASGPAYVSYTSGFLEPRSLTPVSLLANSDRSNSIGITSDSRYPPKTANGTSPSCSPVLDGTHRSSTPASLFASWDDSKSWDDANSICATPDSKYPPKDANGDYGFASPGQTDARSTSPASYIASPVEPRSANLLAPEYPAPAATPTANPYPDVSSYYKTFTKQYKNGALVTAYHEGNRPVSAGYGVKQEYEKAPWLELGFFVRENESLWDRVEREKKEDMEREKKERKTKKKEMRKR